MEIEWNHKKNTQFILKKKEEEKRNIKNSEGKSYNGTILIMH